MITFLYKALLKNKPEFVDLFLEVGVPVSKFMWMGINIESLYREVSEVP